VRLVRAPFSPQTTWPRRTDQGSSASVRNVGTWGSFGSHSRPPGLAEGTGFFVEDIRKHSATEQAQPDTSLDTCSVAPKHLPFFWE
jgi:hypothetical protein